MGDPSSENIPDCVLLVNDVRTPDPKPDMTGMDASVTDQARRQAESLERLLHARGRTLRVLYSFLHRPPRLFDTMKILVSENKTRILVVPLLPFPARDFRADLRNAVDDALADLHAEREEPVRTLISGLPGDRPGFIQACASRIREALRGFGGDANPSSVELVLVTTPGGMQAPPSPDITRRIAERAGIKSHRIGGLDDLPVLLEGIARDGKRRVLAFPVGNVIEDPDARDRLDGPVRAVAEGLGIRFVRPPAVHCHPSFIASLSSIVEEHLP